MDHLFTCWEKLKDELRDEFIFICLDYDGTLTPIADTPDKAALSDQAKSALMKLINNSGCRLSIISGRSLQDIKMRVGLENVIYAGNHGLEIEGPSTKLEGTIPERLRAVIRHIYKELQDRLIGIRGVIVEDKTITLSIHYRMAKSDDALTVKKIVNEITKPYLGKNKMKVTAGKKVLEIKPDIEWDKGKVVLWLLARQQFKLDDKKILPIYIGDDVTDEDAFKVLRSKGLTIFVGESGISQAEYYLKDTKEVIEFISRLTELKK